MRNSIIAIQDEMIELTDKRRRPVRDDAVFTAGGDTLDAETSQIRMKALAGNTGTVAADEVTIG